MDFVCNDINGPSKWYFDEGKYYRIMANGEQRYFLDGDNLADPADIEAKGKTPQDSTVKLFADWQKRKA